MTGLLNKKNMKILERCLGAEILKKQNRILKLIISYSYCLIGASKQQNLHQAPQTGPKQALIAPKWLLVGLVTQTNWIDVITNFISIVFKICGSSKSNYFSFDQNNLIKNLILFCKCLSPQKSHRNGFVLFCSNMFPCYGEYNVQGGHYNTVVNTNCAPIIPIISCAV